MNVLRGQMNTTSVRHDAGKPTPVHDDMISDVIICNVEWLWRAWVITFKATSITSANFYKQRVFTINRYLADYVIGKPRDADLRYQIQQSKSRIPLLVMIVTSVMSLKWL